MCQPLSWKKSTGSEARTRRRRRRRSFRQDHRAGSEWRLHVSSNISALRVARLYGHGVVRVRTLDWEAGKAEKKDALNAAILAQRGDAQCCTVTISGARKAPDISRDRIKQIHCRSADSALKGSLRVPPEICGTVVARCGRLYCFCKPSLTCASMTRLKAAASLGAQTHSIRSVSGGISFRGSLSRGVHGFA